MLKIKDTAPDFTLYSTAKQQITLSSLRGKQIVLLFFPAAFTSTCTKELCFVRDNISTYNNLNAVVFGISTDMVYSLVKFKEEQQLNFELLSDYNREVIQLYHTAYETFNYGMKGVAKRSAFVIGIDGIIKYAEVLENASLVPDFEKIKEAITR
ncbi:MAG: peroxiredoxin [Bacteroidia bacterium]|nr:peroxiredoxin [Bacteroidia bacterium]